MENLQNFGKKKLFFFFLFFSSFFAKKFYCRSFHILGGHNSTRAHHSTPGRMTEIHVSYKDNDTIHMCIDTPLAHMITMLTYRGRLRLNCDFSLSAERLFELKYQFSALDQRFRQLFLTRLLFLRPTLPPSSPGTCSTSVDAPTSTVMFNHNPQEN